MTIDGVDISTFGLILSRFDGHLDQPARKKILSVPGFEAKDIVFESKEHSFTLVGIYASKVALFSGVEALKTLIKSALVHNFVVAAHGVTFSGVVAEGIKPKVTNIMAELYFKVKVVE